MKTFYFYTTLAFLCAFPLYSKSGELLETRTVTTGLNVPWEILWGPDDWIWATERAGRVIRIHPETGEVVEVVQLNDVYTNGESGLLGMAVVADQGKTKVFLVYTYEILSGIFERLVSYDYNGTTLLNPTVLIENIPASSIHDGSRLIIHGGKLLMTTGDAANSSNAQSMQSLSGKILRFNLDGSAPSDNPFSDEPFPANYIWTLGHRNPQGLVSASNGILYSSEHGPSNDDEVNIIHEGRNYGWPLVEGMCDQQFELQYCESLNVAEPIRAWTPTLAVCGVDYYNSDAIPSWKNSLILVTLKDQDIRLLQLNQGGDSIVDERTYYNRVWGRLRDLCISPNGRVFVATSNKDGRGTPGSEDDQIIEIRTANGSITQPQLPKSTFCSGETTTVSFTIDDSFPVGTEFAVELSDTNGDFQNAYELGLTFLDAGEGPDLDVEITFPPVGLVLQGLSGYRIRVVGLSSTGETSSPSSEVAFFPLLSTVASPFNGRLCGDRDSLLLRLSGGEKAIRSVQWSTGDTTLTTYASDSETYTATLIDTNGCSYTISIPVEKYPLPTVEIIPSKIQFCQGDSAILQAKSEDGGGVFQWSTGQTGERIVVKSGGIYSVQTVSGAECLSDPDSVFIQVFPLPPIPSIQQKGDTLTANRVAFAYQWFYNGELLPNATERSLIVRASGEYRVAVQNEEGCEAVSVPYPVTLSGVADGDVQSPRSVAFYPQPVGERLIVEFSEEVYGSITIRLSDIEGRQLRTMNQSLEGGKKVEVDVSTLTPGVYLLTLTAPDLVVTRRIVRE